VRGGCPRSPSVDRLTRRRSGFRGDHGWLIRRRSPDFIHETVHFRGREVADVVFSESNSAAIIERAEKICHSPWINLRAEAATGRSGNELSAIAASRAGTATFADGPSCPRLIAAIF